MGSTIASTVYYGVTLGPGGDASPLSITSAGTVLPGQSGNNVYLGYSGVTGIGSLFNAGHVAGGNAQGSYSLGGDGISLTDSTVTNMGIIVGGAAYGSFSSGGDGVYLSSSLLENSGTILGGAGSRFGGDGVIINGGDVLENAGTILGGAGHTGGLGVLDNASTLVNTGTISGGKGSAGVRIYEGTVVNAGLIAAAKTAGLALQFTAGGDLVLDFGAVFSGAVDGASDSVLELSGVSIPANFDMGGSFSGFGTIAFDDFSAGWRLEGKSAELAGGQTITGFTAGDTLVLDGFVASSASYVVGVGLELTDGGRTETLAIAGSFTTADFTVIAESDATAVETATVPCFLPGTRILTAAGEKPVEDIVVGDLLYLASGGLLPVVWIGWCNMDTGLHRNPIDVMPVLIQRGALGNALPCRDLMVSPDHAMFLDGHLIPARSLVNGRTIRHVGMDRVTYFHVELPRHGIIYAEGALTETFLECGNRSAFTNNQVVDLRPTFNDIDFQARRIELSCAPFADNGPVVHEVRRRLLQIAQIPLSRDHGTAVEMVGGDAHIVSRSVVPGMVEPDPGDQRRLGVKLSAIRANGKDIPLDHPLLVEGWHDMEADGRWTNGHAIVPAALLNGATAIELSYGWTTLYPVKPQEAEEAMFA